MFQQYYNIINGQCVENPELHTIWKEFSNINYYKNFDMKFIHC